MVSNKPFCLIIIPLALLVLLLPAVKAYPPRPVFYESCDFYGPPNITANPPRKNKYVVNVMSFHETFGVQPVSFNLTAHTNKRLPRGRAVIQLMPSSTGKTITRNVDLCSLTRGGCPIHHGNFTVSFDLSFDGFYQVQFSMFAKSGKLLTCVFFEESDPTKMPSEPTPPSRSYEPTPAPPESREPSPAPSESHEPTPAPSESREPTPAQSESHEPTPAPSESHKPTPAPSESHEPTPAPSESHKPTPAPSESHEPTPAPSEPSQGQTEPPSTGPVWFESCDWDGPPNITETPPPEKNYHVWLKSFDMSWKKQPLSHNLTAHIDKLLPGGRAVTQLNPGGNTIIRNVDLCGLTRGGCPIQPGDFTVSFDLYIDHFTQIQFALFAENGELLLCVFFEESNWTG